MLLSRILIIGSPAGISRYLQVFYIALGLGIITLAGVLLATGKRPAGMA